MNILVTGGAGFIGSHTNVELLESGHELIVFDNFSNSERSVLERVEKISGKSVELVEGDLLNPEDLSSVFRNHSIDGVIHFAALKAVGESVAYPLRYYRNNITGTVNLLDCMVEHQVNTFVFSSSATVYGEPSAVPITEDESIKATNPYGQTKAMMEQILLDLAASRPEMKLGILRYFNPVGAHASGLIGEAPTGVPNNLVPFIAQVATGMREQVSVFGNDYPTPDGTGVRDYIHVVDLAKAHLATLNYLTGENSPDEPLIVNLGTGNGYSVLEVIQAFEKASGKAVPYQIVDRRPGDIPTCYSEGTKAKELLGWEAKLDLDAMCQDAWRWMQHSQTL
ncbi:UDP-glucose 4-epimerase GalE [Opitutia bacterium ISCC 51]|nr:UDP-glucose 4-epimerase GalE [Opitutae bacterium ISCC 51]QXD27587.1 UDP-glucose 4-epimerase GalE [Opitutae bacterium ISCC 52]